MKTNKSPESTEVTPSKKKLTQARLPFKLISDSPPVAPQTRKRKLSAPDAESVTKVGKISKENDIIEDPVVISDDDSKDGQKVPKIVKEDKHLNPFVKLVDTAWKKKLEKSKKKKNNKKKSAKNQQNGSAESANESANDTGDDKDTCEAMDVDPPEIDRSDKNGISSETSTECGNKQSDTVVQETKSESEPTAESLRNIENNEPIESNEVNKTDVVVLEDSNNSSDVITSQKSNCDVEQKEAETIQNTDKDTTNESPEKEENKTIIVTPKRSARIKANSDEKNNSTLSSSKLDESMSSEPATPKQNRSSSVTSVGDESMNDSTRKLTPKQVQKKLESAKKKEEREKERLEREKKKQEEKDERARQRLEKEEQKKKEREEKEEAKKREKEEKEEAKKKEREEKEEQKKKEKEEKEKQKELEKKLREEKEEQKRKEREAKEEEKRKKQEAIELEKQEQELKKKKAAEAFVNFFVPKQKTEKDQPTVCPVSKNNVLSSFTIKSDMRLAPTVRTDLSEDKKQTLDSFLVEQNASVNALYLKSLRNGIKPLSCGKTWPLSDKDIDDDVIVVEDELPPIDGAGEIITCDTTVREKLRPKLLSFEENRRPPYWGTWRKKSASVKPRKPFGQDKHLDYEVDSDDDWEEEQEGESIDGSAAGSDDEQDADEYEVDNEVFVPHGYLSDEEATMDEDDVLSLSPETQKARLKHLEDEFESEMKKPTEKLKPRLYGLLWETTDGGKPEKCVDALWNYFGKLSMIMNESTTLLQPSNEPEDSEKKKVKRKKAPVVEGEEQIPKAEKKRKAKPENKETKKPKPDPKKNIPNQPGINTFLTKMKT